MCDIYLNLLTEFGSSSVYLKRPEGQKLYLKLKGGNRCPCRRTPIHPISSRFSHELDSHSSWIRMNHYYIPLTDQPDENTFLCGYRRVRKYGTTVSSTETKPKHFIIYQVQPSDTIQGIALKNNCSVSEIVRINKLWSVDSLHFKETIKIPVVSSPDDNMIVTDYSSKPLGTFSKSPISSTGVEFEENPTETLKDMLSRIDRTIKNTSTSVKKLERSSTIVNDFSEQTRPEHHSLQNLCSGYYQQL